MAYDQNSFYQPPQRPYNGRAAQPPVQTYGQGAPAQQYDHAQAYPPQGPYDQYAQDGYGQDGYNNGYAENYDNQHRQPMNNGSHGGRGQQPPPNQGYPTRQDYYGNGGGRGEDPRSQSRAGGRGVPPQGRPPMTDNGRGPADNRGGGGSRGYPNGNGGQADGRVARPPPIRAGHSDPGGDKARRQVPPPQRSPQTVAWDTPFPSFPGNPPNKKNPELDDQKLAQQVGSMDINDQRNQQRPAGGSGVDPRSRGPPAGDGYVRPPGESQRSAAPRGYPPQPGFGGPQAQRPGPGLGPGPAPAPGYGRPPKQNAYAPSGYDQGYAASTPTSPVRDDFAPISRSMTLPTDIGQNSSTGPNGVSRHPSQSSIVGPGPSAPYNGPIGRGPPRPATANEIRPPPQREYQHQVSQPYQTNETAVPSRHPYSHHTMASISDLYDAYYEPHSRGHSMNNEIRDFENPQMGPNRGTSRDDYGSGTDSGSMPQRQQVNGYPPATHTQSQPDFRAQVQPQSAIYEMVGDAPPPPRGNPPMGFPDDGYGQHRNQPEAQSDPRNPGYGKGAGQYYDQQQQQSNPPRQNSSAARGPPGGPAPYANGNGMAPSQNSNPPRPHGSEVLPPHPAPVRAGLIPNSVASQAQANNKPPPVRNHGNTSNQAPASKPPAQIPPIKSPPPGPPPVTLDELERLKVLVKGNPNDLASSLLIARKWVEAIDVLVPAISDPKTRTKHRERYVFDAHKMLKKLVASQNTDAMFFLADCYGRGILTIENENKEAFSLYQSAAKAGHAGAAYRTAVCCELGNEEGGGTRKDPMKAIQWYQRAATLGDTPAMYKMGMIQLKGLLGQPKNPREAIGWLKRAAERADQENPHALHELGLLYESVQPPDGSSSVIRDEAYALSLFQQAAELGYKFSQFRLGCAFEYGLFNLDIDARMSIMWYSRAAVQEEHQSELALSGWYLTGSEGVLQQSDTEAYLWARKAAMAGLAKAEYAMGYFTEVGIGAPADIEGAKRWYWRAAAQNFPKARERLEDLKKGGSKPQLKSRERVSRSKIGKQNEGECVVM